MRIQACYGTAGCSGWTQLGDADDGLDGATVIPGNKVGNARIEVAKTTIDIGERLQVTIYDVPVGEVAYVNMYGSIQPEGRCPGRTRDVAPRRVGEPSTGGWYDSFRIDGCPDGGVGHIRVTNHDESKLYASATITVREATITPPKPPTLEPQIPSSPPPPLPPPNCNATPAIGPSPPDQLTKPTSLTITPRLQRQAVLRWDQVTDAQGYRILVRRLRANPGTDPIWEPWVRIDRTRDNGQFPNVVRRNCHTIDLAKVTRESRSVYYGISNTMGFHFKITATSDQSDESSSAELIVVDNPITVANGHSPITPPIVPGDATPPGRVELTWKFIVDHIPGIDYSGGNYYFRYRQATPGHDKSGWQPGIYTDVNTIADSELHLGNKIEGLRRNQIYALQMIYSKRDTPMIFSAVDAYVWPSHTRAERGQRVATFPLSQRLSSDRTFRYRVCVETFEVEGDARKGEWLALINDVFRKWESATNLIHAWEDTLYCTSYTLIVDLVSDKIGRIDSSRSKDDRTDDVEAFLAGTKDGLALDSVPPDNIIDLVSAVNQHDAKSSEIIMFDYGVGTDPARLAAEVNFKQISQLIGYSACWDPAATRGNAAVMCAVSQFVNGSNVGDGVTTDIFINRVKYEMKTIGGVMNASDSDACVVDRNSAYGAFMHEVGHALGVGGGSTVDDVGGKWEATSHPEVSLKDSAVMISARPNCQPYPFDVLAIYALYQSPA